MVCLTPLLVQPEDIMLFFRFAEKFSCNVHHGALKCPGYPTIPVAGQTGLVRLSAGHPGRCQQAASI
jgi:hypothetical protein